MSFDTVYRYFAFESATLAAATQLRDGFGELASIAPGRDGDQVKTLLCGLDNAETGEMRALILGVNAVQVALSDGRYCLGGYWAAGMLNNPAVLTGSNEELTLAEVEALLPDETY